MSSIPTLFLSRNLFPIQEKVGQGSWGSNSHPFFFLAWVHCAGGSRLKCGYAYIAAMPVDFLINWFWDIQKYGKNERLMVEELNKILPKSCINDSDGMILPPW